MGNKERERERERESVTIATIVAHIYMEGKI